MVTLQQWRAVRSAVNGQPFEPIGIEQRDGCAGRWGRRRTTSGIPFEGSRGLPEGLRSAVSEGLSKSLFSSMIRAKPRAVHCNVLRRYCGTATVRMWPQCTPPASHSTPAAPPAAPTKKPRHCRSGPTVRWIHGGSIPLSRFDSRACQSHQSPVAYVRFNNTRTCQYRAKAENRSLHGIS